MPSCLGIYVENNLIKYAKVYKDRETIKVEAFGIKFYDKLEETLRQIIRETYSYKTPISINISDEKYTYSNLFTLLNKKYFDKAVDTEFESFCNDTGKNKNAIEMRHFQVENLEDKDKATILYSYCNKSNIVSKTQMLDGFKIEGMYALPLVIKNLTKSQNSQNSIIINIENKTSVTTLVNGKIYRIDLMDLGMEEILNNINVKENSYQKSYEICKNSTIYTLNSRNLQTEENDYMDDIMPTLYSIIEKTKEIIERNVVEIQNIYITGLATSINNLDLYFQENFQNKNCEILAPYFAQKSNLKLNIRDYIEVNSAIALGLQGLGEGEKGVNFKKQTGFEGISKILAIDIGGPKNNKLDKPKVDIRDSLKSDFAGPLTRLEKNSLKSSILLILIIIMYIVGEKWLVGSIDRKQKEITDSLQDTESKIATVVNYNKLVTTRTDEYNSLIEKIDSANNELTQSYASKNAIPNFLTQTMFNMPKYVQLISIKNNGKSIEIVAQAEKYEQLGYLKAALKNSGILTDITSTSGTKKDELIEVTITGNLPY